MLHDGYEVWVADSKKHRLPEYHIQVEGDGKAITCYIPSESGKQFSIRWKDHNGPTSHHISVQTFVDGIPAGKTHCPPGAGGKRLGVSTDSAATYSTFQFAALQTTDDDNALWSGGIPEQLGTIEVRIIHVLPHLRVAAFKPVPFAGVSSVHERSKKAGTHCVALGRAKQYGKHHTQVRTTPLDRRAGPFASFVFRYRPAAILQAQGIMPHSYADGTEAGSSALGKKRGDASGAPAREERKPVKTELRDAGGEPDGGVIDLTDDDDVDRKPIVKREHRPLPSFDPNEVIDLTLD